MQLPGVTDRPTVDHHLGAAARMPRQVLCGPQFDVYTGSPGDHPDCLEGIGRLHCPARSPRPAGFPQTGENHRNVHGLAGQRVVDGGDLGVGGPAVGGDQFHRAGMGGRLRHLGNREQRHITEAAGDIARQRFQQRGHQGGGQMRTIGLQWIEHRGGIAARVVGGQTPLVEHPGGQERRRQHLGEARQCQRLADRAAALLARGQSAARGGGWQHRGDGVEALQSQHLLDEVGGRDDIGTPTRRGDGQYIRTRVGCHPGTDLREAAHRGAVGIHHTGHPIGKVDGHPHRAR